MQRERTQAEARLMKRSSQKAVWDSLRRTLRDYTPCLGSRGATVPPSTRVYHHRILRTTIDIPEQLLVEAKQLAAERHLPLTRVFEDSLRLYLGEQRLRRAQAEPAPLPLLRDPVPVEGVDLNDTSRLWELE